MAGWLAGLVAVILAAVLTPVRATTYGNAVVVSPPAAATSKFFAPALADLRAYLQQITGRPFELSAAPSAGGIHLSLTGSEDAPPDAVRRLEGKGLDCFVLTASGSSVWIVSNDIRGLANGIYFYLEQLGVRWLLPGPNWTVVPKRADILLTVDTLVEPSFKVRSYAGTGGFYSLHWGRGYAGSALFEAGVRDWQRRLRYGGEYALGRSVGEAFIQDPKIDQILEQHPEYLAQVGSGYTPLRIQNKAGNDVLNVNAKLNAGSTDAVDLFCGWVRNRLRAARATPDAATHTVTPVEPSDGYGYGTNTAELPGDGSPSDQTFFIANQCAKQVRAEFLDAFVILYAYAGHAAPPSFAIEPNVIVQLAPYAFQTLATPEKFIGLWQAHAARLALYDYWSIPDWAHDEPSFDYADLGRKLQFWRTNRIEALNAESTYGAGAMGLAHYLAAHLMWNVAQDQGALEQDWFDHAFGPAQGPMRRMFARWVRGFRLQGAEIGNSYGDLQAAERLASGRPDIVARIDDIARYVHYLQLRLELMDATAPEDRAGKAVALARFLLAINDSLMVHTTRIVDLEVLRSPQILEAFPPASERNAQVSWAPVAPLSHDDVRQLIQDGTDAYPRSDFEPVEFSGPLMSLPNATKAGEPGSGWGPAMSLVGDLNGDFRVSPPSGRTSLRVTTRVENDVTIRNDKDVIVATHHVPASGDLKTWEDFSFDLPVGRYTIKIHPQGGRAAGYFGLQVPNDLPLALRSFLSPKPGPSPRLYFYVPKGLGKLAIWLPDGDFSNTFKFEVRDPDGRAAPIERRDSGRTMVIKVPLGMDGAVWSMIRAVSPNQPLKLLNAPQTFAFSPETLLVPRDALRP